MGYGHPFWKEIFNMWYIYANNLFKSTSDILNEPIWYNNKLTDKVPLIPGWAKHIVLKIEDLLNVISFFCNRKGCIRVYNNYAVKYDYYAYKGI